MRRDCEEECSETSYSEGEGEVRAEYDWDGWRSSVCSSEGAMPRAAYKARGKLSLLRSVESTQSALCALVSLEAHHTMLTERSKSKRRSKSSSER